MNRTAFIASLALAGFVAAKNERLHPGTEFGDFIGTYNKSYKSVGEFTTRMAVYEECDKTLRKANKKAKREGHTLRLAHN